MSGEAGLRAEPPAAGQKNLKLKPQCISGLERSDKLKKKHTFLPGRAGRGQFTSMDTAKQQALEQAQLQAQ